MLHTDSCSRLYESKREMRLESICSPTDPSNRHHPTFTFLLRIVILGFPMQIIERQKIVYYLINFKLMDM